MYRRIVLYNSEYISGSATSVLYHARGARVLSQHRAIETPYDSSITNGNEFYAAVFDDSVLLRTTAGRGPNRMYKFDLDVSENQPVKESVEEITETGTEIVVYNENDVVVCRNVPKPPANSAPAQTDGPGEMTSEPIDGPGEMTNELIGDQGATI